MLIMTFEHGEDELIEQILNFTNQKAIKIHEITDKSRKLLFEGLEIDRYSRTVYKNSKNIELTYIEFEILTLLAKHSGRVFSKEQIYNLVWDEPFYNDCSIVMTHVRNLREKIEDLPKNPKYIQTVWGVGYRFNKNKQ